MKQLRRLFTALGIFIGIWVLVSFTGTMVDTANVSFWSSSLMWSLLSSLVVMPALVVVTHASKEASRKSARTRARRAEREQEPFIQEGSDQTRTLWPEPEQEAKPSPEERSSERGVRT